MCLLAVYFQRLDEAPILVAANREEAYGRPTFGPLVQSGSPPVLCGVDRLAGGTWLGVNAFGVLVTVTNRPRPLPPAGAPSRGILCRQLLNASSATAAAEMAVQQLSTGRYSGANFVCLDATHGFVAHGGEKVQIQALTPGWHFLTNGDLDDATDARLQLARTMLTREPIESIDAFLQTAAAMCSAGPNSASGQSIVLRAGDRGTVSSTLVALARDPQQSVYRYAAGPPDTTPYDDVSPLLRQVLTSGSA
jgi:uncharacterized protein with NRDE domain